ncbi:MAG TPA: hypothetical protein VMH37_10700 [Candidatus Binataceae bacterium]|nr:hypothetical protein [Candidatus Binataceae bacterium]
MNCFEARQEFRAFWRRELKPEDRAALVTHLAECAKCDRAFRDFALSAPGLHSAEEPPRRTAAERPAMHDAHSRRPAAVVRSRFAPRRGFAMSAAAMVLVAASLAAYFSVTAPIDTLNDELSAEPAATQLFGTDLNLSSEDLAG